VAALRAAARNEAYVMYRRHYHRTVAVALARCCAELHPDAIYLDHLDSFVYEPCPGAVTVGDLHNVYSRLVGRAAADEATLAGRLYLSREARLLARAEARMAGRADLVFTVSADEHAYFDRLGTARVEVIPNGVECARYADLPTGRSCSPPVVMFLGAMSWPPNADAARSLAAMLPALRGRFPDLRLRLVGKHPPSSVANLAADPAIQVTGAVADVRPYLAEASLLAVPLSAGGGTRLKILEAFASGLPVVSTPIGSEGLDVAHGEHLIVAPASAFASALGDALDSPVRSSEMAARARALVRSRYDWDRIGEIATAAIEAACSRSRASARHAAPST
jgi:glycosyltransferase involved in cell wall biosynthesis